MRISRIARHRRRKVSCSGWFLHLCESLVATTKQGTGDPWWLYWRRSKAVRGAYHFRHVLQQRDSSVQTALPALSSPTAICFTITGPRVRVGMSTWCLDIPRTWWSKVSTSSRKPS
ncbi:hypothetical protein EK21DRAFT_93678 [Setomelanomma holmii]|uniref:Uncharacterized protein n=1 Tax=Setomelanomma holmii TaxID=210430 RepID=A0A9P4H083_9PLEO|nr:hypothetical protein EK21DRAFT_93678 [Setomelanomma holmii]